VAVAAAIAIAAAIAAAIAVAAVIEIAVAFFGWLGRVFLKKNTILFLERMLKLQKEKSHFLDIFCLLISDSGLKITKNTLRFFRKNNFSY